MINNSLSNINKNKTRMSKLDEQYATGKKIQRPSDDPIVAVRALKLRTTVSEINQYFNKNIPDAMSWMETTESALKNINGILTNIHTQYNQGANDPLSRSDRDSIIKNLEEMKNQIYQEGNTNYAGRYVFTGYKTNSSLMFNETSENMQYTIHETFSGSDIDKITTISGGYDVSAYEQGVSTMDTFKDAPVVVEGYRIRLSYDNLDDVVLDEDNLTYTITDKTATPPTKTQSKITAAITDTPPGLGATVNKISVTDPDAYKVGDDEINFIPETGELILGKNVYNALRNNGDGEIGINYDKTKFSKGDLKPEHYFDCSTVDITITDTAEREAGRINYTSTTQKIEYEITFKQKLAVNTEGKDAITHGIGRDIEELINAANDVTAVENKISEVEKLMEHPDTTEADKLALSKLQEQLETELVLKNDILQKKFASGLTSTEQYQEKINVALADAGSRYVRLELTESRLDTQLVDAKELMSNNEDADLAEVIINYMSAESIYNASLTAASKIVKNTLLDFI